MPYRRNRNRKPGLIDWLSQLQREWRTLPLSERHAVKGSFMIVAVIAFALIAQLSNG